MYKMLMNVAKDPDGIIFAGGYDDLKWLRPDQISGLIARGAVERIPDYLGDKNLPFAERLSTAKVFTLSELEKTDPVQLAAYLSEEIFVVEGWVEDARAAFAPPVAKKEKTVK